MAERTVFVSLRAKVDGYTSGLNKAAKSTDAFAKKAKDAQRQAETWNKVGLAGAALGAGVAVLVKKSIDSASALSETVAKTGTIFGKSADQIESFGDTAAQQLGMSKRAAMDAASTFAVFGKSAGLAGSDLVGFSTQLTGLAADLASFYNTSPEDAILAIGAALRGESEPIRQYGVLLDDATLKARAMSMGIYEGTGSLTQQQRVLAAQAEILAQTSDAQGDVARTADGLANTQRRLAASWEDATAGLGEGFLPVAAGATDALSKMLNVVNGLPGPLKTTAVVTAAVAAAALMATPRILAMQAAMAEAGISAGAMAGKMGRLVGAAGVITLIAVGLNEGSSKFKEWTGQVAVGGDEATRAITEIATSGVVTDEVLRRLGGGVNNLGDALHNNLNMGFAQGAVAAGAWVSSLGGLLPWYDEAIPKSEEFFQSLDAGLATMASQGPAAAAEAAKAFQVVAVEAQKQGISVDELKTLFPQYTAVLGPAATAQATAAASAQRLGTMEYLAAAAAEEATAAHKGLADALSDMASKDAALSALNALKQSLKENGKAFHGASEAALANRAALAEAATTADAHAAKMTNNGKKAEYLSGRIDAIRKALVDAGAKGPEIERILGPLEKVRDKAQRAAAAMDDLAGTYTVTTLYRQQGRTPAGPTGGQAVHPAAGGYIRGPGTSTSDSIPAWLSDGEFVVRAAAVDKYGLDLLWDINAMRLAPGGEVSAEKRKARKQARRDARRSTSEARFQTSLFGLSDVDAALATLKREQDRLAKLKKGTVAWFQQKAVVEQAREGLRVARKQAGADALADQAAADAEALAEANAAIDEQRSKVEQLAQAWSQQVDAVQSALAAQSALSFDFDAQKKAVDDVTAAEQELLDARRAANVAAGPDRAAALDRVRAAEDDLASARAKAKAAEPTFDNVYAGFQQKMQALAAFRSNIETLAKRGIHSSILQQLISQGMNGGAEMAAALVKFTPEQLGAINATQARIESDANAIGQISGNAMLGAQIMDAGQAQAVIQISGGQPIQLNLDTRQVYAGLLELARQQGGTLSWTAA